MARTTTGSALVDEAFLGGGRGGGVRGAASCGPTESELSRVGMDQSCPETRAAAVEMDSLCMGNAENAFGEVRGPADTLAGFGSWQAVYGVRCEAGSECGVGRSTVGIFAAQSGQEVTARLANRLGAGAVPEVWRCPAELHACVTERRASPGDEAAKNRKESSGLEEQPTNGSVNTTYAAGSQP